MKKAQAAMEFLMTYGWAILVILIVLSALFYLGVFTPRVPNSCIATAPITCVTVRATAADALTLELGASGVSSATITNFDLASPDAAPCTPSPTTISITTPTVSTCTVTSDLTTGQRFAGAATLIYVLQGSTVTHTTTVQFSGTVE
ncbi:MAG: hypothetical protein AABX55_01610 [Nanoarchaeota archaeon]